MLVISIRILFRRGIGIVLDGSKLVMVRIIKTVIAQIFVELLPRMMAVISSRLMTAFNAAFYLLLLIVVPCNQGHIIRDRP